jgi:hypothetical protein
MVVRTPAPKRNNPVELYLKQKTMAKKKEIMEPVITDPITEQAETVLSAAENLLFELEVLAEKQRMAQQSIKRVVAAKEMVVILKKNLSPLIQ